MMDQQRQFTEILQEMTEYYKDCIRRVNHFLKVWAYARYIGLCEGLPAPDQFILEVTALMHDIGIRPSEEKYHSSAGRYQELEGPAAARPILEKHGFTPEQTERICYLIAHHHTYTGIDSMDYQILVEADFLVNLDEEGQSPQAARTVCQRVFRTRSGKRCLETLYLDRQEGEA